VALRKLPCIVRIRSTIRKTTFFNQIKAPDIRELARVKLIYDATGNG